MASQTLIALGGKGANQAVAASRMGAFTTFIGAIGSDAFGADVEQRLLQHNVSVNLSIQNNDATGMAFIDVGPDGSNLIRVSSGANRTLSRQIVDNHASTISNSKIILLQNEIPFEASRRAAEIASASSVMVMMDPAPAPVPFSWPLGALETFSILTPNSHETRLITGHEPRNLSEAEDAARKLQDFGISGSIVTMGKMGVAWSINGITGMKMAPEVASIDTVAAGDCFNGAFAAAISSGKPIDASIDIAVYAAALATTRKGAAGSIPTYEELFSTLPFS